MASPWYTGGVAVFGAVQWGLAWRHRQRVGSMPFDNKERATVVEQVRVLRIACNADKALLAAKQAVMALPKAKGVRIAGRCLGARIGMTMDSFGERIAVTVSPMDGESARMQVESKPRLSSTVLDYGKNFENVERIVERLRAQHDVEVLSASA